MEAGAPVRPTERRISQPAAAGRRTEDASPRLRVTDVRSPRAAYAPSRGLRRFLALDYRHGLELRHLPPDPRPVHHVYDPRHVLVGLRHLLVHRGARRRADQDPLRFELHGDVARPRELLRLVSAEAAPGPVAARAERLLDGPGRDHQPGGVAPHVSWNQHG